MGQKFDHIEINPQILLGKPVIRGTRIPVYVIVGLVAEGKDTNYILTHYPDLKKEHVTEALQYAAWSTQLPQAYA